MYFWDEKLNQMHLNTNSNDANIYGCILRGHILYSQCLLLIDRQIRFISLMLFHLKQLMFSGWPSAALLTSTAGTERPPQDSPWTAAWCLSLKPHLTKNTINDFQQQLKCIYFFTF